MTKRRRGLLIQCSILAGALFHFLTLTLPGRNPTVFWIPVLLSVGYLIFRYRTRLFKSHRALSLLTVSILITSTIADHLLNIVPFEPHAHIQVFYRQFQSLLLLTIPVLATIFGERSKKSRTVILFGLCLQLLPPYSYAMMTQFLVPAYGRTILLLYILMAIPGTRIRLDRSIVTVLVLLPLVALPALFYAHSPGNTVDHIVVSSLFIAAALILSTLPARNTEVLINLILGIQALQILFSIVFPGLHAVNSNVTAMAAEWIMILALYRFVQIGGIRGVAAGFITVLAVLLLMIRIDSNSGLVAAACGAGIFLYMHIVHRRLPIAVRSVLLPAGLVILVSAALYYLLYIAGSSSIQIRRLLWEMALKGTAQSPITALLGTGDFGPYHFFLFRHLDRSLTSSETALLQGDPWLIGHHPHNDFLLILYGGGLIFLLLSGYLIARTLISSLRQNTPFSSMSAALMGAIIVHGLTEPFTTSPATGFLFYAAIIFYWKQFSKAPLGINRVTTVLVSIPLLFLISVAALHAPVTRFWKHHNDILLELQSGRRVSPLQKEGLEAARKTIERIDLLTALQPSESDLFKQQGDLLTAIASTTGSEKEFQLGFDAYCRAFSLRSSPIHFQSLKSAHRFAGAHVQCLGMTLDELENTYDPHDLTHFIQTVPEKEK